MKVEGISFYKWVELLEKYGSENDPIWYNGKETTPAGLEIEFDSLMPIKGIKIKYWGGLPVSLINGSPGGMLKDRKRVNTDWKRYEELFRQSSEYCDDPLISENRFFGSLGGFVYAPYIPMYVKVAPSAIKLDITCCMSPCGGIGRPRGLKIPRL